MAGEKILHIRLHQEMTMEELLQQETGLTEEQLNGYYFIFRFDREKIRLPKVRRPDGTLTITDQQDIFRLIENNWMGDAQTTEQLELMIAPFDLYDRMPIVVEMYPKKEADAAAKGAWREAEFEEHGETPTHDEEERQEKYDQAMRIIQELEELRDAFVTQWNTAQSRKEDGRFGDKVGAKTQPHHDKVTYVQDRKIRIAPSGQVRMGDGSLGPAPVDRLGKRYAGSPDNKDLPFRIRRDGAIWMRIRNPGGKRKTKWVKIS